MQIVKCSCIIILLLSINAVGQAALTQTEVSQLYVSIFGRASEGEGSLYWQNDSNSVDMAAVANTMLDTDPAKEYFGNKLHENQDFIHHIYLNTLGKNRWDDPEGVQYWVTQLNAGISRGDVIASLIVAAQAVENAGASQVRFNNRVEVSNYCADKIHNHSRLDLFKEFINDVTDDSMTVNISKDYIDSSAASQDTTSDNEGSESNSPLDDIIDGDNEVPTRPSDPFNCLRPGVGSHEPINTQGVGVNFRVCHSSLWPTGSVPLIYIQGAGENPMQIPWVTFSDGKGGYDYIELSDRAQESVWLTAYSDSRRQVTNWDATRIDRVLVRGTGDQETFTIEDAAGIGENRSFEIFVTYDDNDTENLHTLYLDGEQPFGNELKGNFPGSLTYGLDVDRTRGYFLSEMYYIFELKALLNNTSMIENAEWKDNKQFVEVVVLEDGHPPQNRAHYGDLDGVRSLLKELKQKYPDRIWSIWSFLNAGDKEIIVKAGNYFYINHQNVVHYDLRIYRYETLIDIDVDAILVDLQ